MTLIIDTSLDIHLAPSNKCSMLMFFLHIYLLHSYATAQQVCDSVFSRWLHCMRYMGEWKNPGSGMKYYMVTLEVASFHTL